MDSGPREWLPTVSGLPGAGLTPFLPHKDLSSTGPPPTPPVQSSCPEKLQGGCPRRPGRDTRAHTTPPWLRAKRPPLTFLGQQSNSS